MGSGDQTQGLLLERRDISTSLWAEEFHWSSPFLLSQQRHLKVYLITPKVMTLRKERDLQISVGLSVSQGLC